MALSLPLLTALWVAAALWLGAPAPWMAVIVAADAGLLLSLLRVPAGTARVAAAAVFLLACSLASAWLIAAGIVGAAFGLMPWESALRLGPVLFSSVAEPWWTASTMVWLAAAALLGVWWNR